MHAVETAFPASLWPRNKPVDRQTSASHPDQDLLLAYSLPTTHLNQLQRLLRNGAARLLTGCRGNQTKDHQPGHQAPELPKSHWQDQATRRILQDQQRDSVSCLEVKGHRQDNSRINREEPPMGSKIRARKTPHLRSCQPLTKGQLKFQHLHTMQKGERIRHPSASLPGQPAERQKNRLASPGDMVLRQQGSSPKLQLWSPLTYLSPPQTDGMAMEGREMTDLTAALWREKGILSPQVTQSQFLLA